MYAYQLFVITVGFDYIFTTSNDFIVNYFNDRDDKQIN